MKLKPWILSLVLLAGLGCDNTIKTKLISEETIVTADMLATSFNEQMKFRLQTDKHIFVGYGTFPPLKVGEKVSYLEGDDGFLYLNFPDSNRLYPVGRK